jgi:predicted outer membrane repeat protein
MSRKRFFASRVVSARILARKADLLFRSRKSKHYQPGFELLEDRALLATIPVTTALDTVNAGDGVTSLREAVAEANATATHDTITFTGLTSGGPAAIVLSLGELWIREALTIDGPGAHLLTIDATGNDPTPSSNNGDGTRIFEIFDGNGTPDKAVSINGVTLTGGDAVAGGGAIFSTELLTLNASKIHNNSARSVGGAVHSTGQVTLAQSTVSGNITPARGGGIFAAGHVTLAHSTVSGNSALYGGGIYSQGAATITQSTISGNSASINGGAIYAVGGGAVTLTHSTFSGNNAGGLGGGIFNLDGPISITGSIVASNAAPVAPDVSPAFSLSVDYSLIGDTSDSGITAGTGTGNQLDVAPQLGPLANNGGPTQTHALLAGSPAIDAGNPAAAAGVGGVPLHDQRGVPFNRVLDGDGASGARIDIGAFEYGGAPPTVTAVRVGSTSWAPSFRQVADPTALDLGYLIPAGAAQLDVLPWTNINQIMLTFSKPMVTSLGDLRLRGVNTASYDALITGFGYDPGTLTATWTLSQVLPKDRYVISLNDTATDTTGSALDGEWANGADAFPSGNGIAGTDFDFNVNILPGDIVSSGAVNNGDFAAFANAFGQPSASFLRSDLNGSGGTVNNGDFSAFAPTFGTSLPAPAVAALSAASETTLTSHISAERPAFRPRVRQPLPNEWSGRGSVDRDIALERFDGTGRLTSPDKGRRETAASGSAIDVALGDLWS